MNSEGINFPYSSHDIDEIEFLIFKENLPRSIVAFDVETTGLGEYDRIVSLGMLRIDRDTITQSNHGLTAIHFACNPQRPSHSKAQAVHKLSSEFLASKPLFKEYYPLISEVLAGGEIIIAHNIAFDMTFLLREFRRIKKTVPNIKMHCTWHETGLSLDKAIAEIGLARAGKKHGALEDAWLSLMLYLYGRGAPASMIRGISHIEAALKASGVTVDFSIKD